MLRNSWLLKSVSFVGKGTQDGDEPPIHTMAGLKQAQLCDIPGPQTVTGEDREEAGSTQVRARETDRALGQAHKEAVSPGPGTPRHHGLRMLFWVAQW